MNSENNSDNKTTLFIDKLSQPSRAVLWFCLNSKIPDFEVKYIQLGKLEQKSPEFQKINPLGKVPAINDKGFSLGESCSIVRYLSDKYCKSNPNKWIPTDLEKRARVDVVLDNYHSTLRYGASRIFWYNYIAPLMNQKIDPALVKDAAVALKNALKTTEANLAKTAFVAGDDISFADMLIYSEIKQLELVDYDFGQFPFMLKWMEKMATVPHHDEVFDVLNKIVAKSRLRKSQAKL